MIDADYIEYKGVIVEKTRSYYLTKLLYLTNNEEDKKRYLDEKNNESKEKADEIFIQGTLSGKMNKNKVRVLVGDYVRIILHISCMKKGRITYRDKSDI